ncbi:MAG: host attachment protein [Nitrospirae bacterium]|nr:host attachment protein [Nitrospirota bacterium]
MKKIIITVDLGHFKAYRVTKNPMESARAELIESYDSIEAHGKLSEKFSDANGRFGLSGGKNGSPTGNGEPHNTGLEMEKRHLKLISKDINTIILKEDCEKWHLAASKKINGKIVENLAPAVKARLDKNITSDLTKVGKAELLGYFE